MIETRGLRHTYPGGSALHFDDVAVAQGDTLLLRGASGSGKSTWLALAAGLLTPQVGEMVVAGQSVAALRAGERDRWRARCIGFLPQKLLLSEALSVADNLALVYFASGLAVDRAAIARALDALDLGALAARQPAQLSGGQAQRVALARALATDPRLLLLDEPLAAMDAGARAELRRGLSRHLAAYDGTCLVITHDPIEAMTLGDQLVVLEAGRVVQAGSPDELASHPRSRYVAELLGLNLYRGRADGRTVQLAGGRQLVAADPVPTSGDVFAVIPPRAVALHRELPEGSPRNVWKGTVEDLDVVGNHVRAHVTGELPIIAEVTPGAVASMRLDDGGQVYVAVKAMEVEVYEA